MLALISLCRSANHPIIYVPGLMGNTLFVTRSKKPNHFYCRGRVVDEPFLGSIASFFPPFHKCKLDDIALGYDNATGEFVAQENVTVRTKYFGGARSLLCPGTVVGKLGCLNSFKDSLRYLRERGYREHENFFVAPNDWRYGFKMTPAFHSQLKTLVEEVYERQGKVVILAHSQGCAITQYFLNTFVTDEWREKHIEFLVYSGPSFGGIPFALAWYVGEDYLSHGRILGTKEFLGLRDLPPVHYHFPHPDFFGNKTVLVTPEGQELNTTEAIEYVVRLGEDPFLADKLAEAEKVREVVMRNTGLHVKMIYQSGVSTIKAVLLNGTLFRKGLAFGRGDFLVPEETPLWIKEHFNTTPDSVIDVAEFDKKCKHPGLIREHSPLKAILDLMGVEQSLDERASEL